MLIRFSGLVLFKMTANTKTGAMKGLTKKQKLLSEITQAKKMQATALAAKSAVMEYFAGSMSSHDQKDSR